MLVVFIIYLRGILGIYPEVGFRPSQNQPKYNMKRGIMWGRTPVLVQFLHWRPPDVRILVLTHP